MEHSCSPAQNRHREHGGRSVTGAVVALLLYTLLLKIVQPVNVNAIQQSLNNKYANTTEDPITHGTHQYKQTNKVQLVFGYVEYVLAATLQFPQWYNPRKKTAKSSCRRHSNEAVIIAICLLLPGDIHQCPGPTSNEASFADSVTCNYFSSGKYI